MATVSLFHCFVEDAAEGKHNLASNTLKVFLTNTAPSLSATSYTGLSGTEIANGNGYTTGGVTATVSVSAQTAGVYSLTLTGVKWTASGGDIPAHRYGVLYNDTAAGKNLIAVADWGVSQTIPNTLSDDLNGTWIGG